jgi:hypothetical protein
MANLFYLIQYQSGRTVVDFFWSDDITVIAWVESNLKTVLQGSYCEELEWKLLIFDKKKKMKTSAFV